MDITLKNVSKYYTNDNTANKGLDDVSVSFSGNEFVAITGESGSGKTTFLNVITSLLDIDQGELLIDGKDTYELTDDDRLKYRRENVAFVFQEYNLIYGLSCLNNLLVALYNLGYEKKEAISIAKDSLTKVGLVNYINKKVCYLSGGERQRVVIARALAIKARILAIDEMTGNLDTKTSNEIIALVKEISNDKLVFYVTHDYLPIENIATRHLVFKDGKIIKDEQLRSNTPIETSSTLEVSKSKKLISSSLKILFSSPSRFFLLLISLFLFTITSLGIGAFGNYSIENPLFYYNYPRNYFEIPDKNSLIVKNNDSIDLSSKTFDDDYIVDKGNFTSVFGIYTSFLPADTALGISNTTEGLYNLKIQPSYSTSNKQQKIYTLLENKSVKGGVDIFLPTIARVNANVLNTLKEYYNLNNSNLSFFQNIIGKSLKYFTKDELNEEVYQASNYTNSLQIRKISLITNSDSYRGYLVPNTKEVYMDLLNHFKNSLFSLYKSNFSLNYVFSLYTKETNISTDLLATYKDKSISIRVNLLDNSDKIDIQLPKYIYDESTYMTDLNFILFDSSYSGKDFKDKLSSNPKKVLPFNDYTSKDDNLDVININLPDTKDFYGLPYFFTNYLGELFSNYIRVINSNSNKINTLANSLADEGYYTEIQFKLIPLNNSQKSYNTIYNGIYGVFFFALFLIFLVVFFITYKIIKNLTKRFKEDSYVLSTLGYSLKSQFLTKFIIINTPILLGYLLMLIILGIIFYIFLGINILLYIYLYLIIFVLDLVIGSYMTYLWFNKSKGDVKND